MNIFVRNVPAVTTNKQLEYYFEGPLRNCGIHVYHVEKRRDKPHATITILEKGAGERFLSLYGEPQMAPRNFRPPLRLFMSPNYLRCTKDRLEPSDFLIQSLAQQAAELVKTSKTGTTHAGPIAPQDLTRFKIIATHCGVWEYDSSIQPRKGTQLVYTTHYEENRPGQIVFGRRNAMIVFGPPGFDQSRVDINYHDCHNINLGTYEEPSVTFDLKMAPKMYEIKAEEVLSAQLASISLGGHQGRIQAPKKVRLPAISEAHKHVASTCWVYRIVLEDSGVLSRIRNLLNRNAAQKCDILSYKTVLRYPEEPLRTSFAKLEFQLTDQAGKYMGKKPFQLRWQLERLAKNGLLSPIQVMKLIGKVKELLETHGQEAVTSSIKRFARDLKEFRPGPGTEAEEFSLARLEQFLEDYAAAYDAHAPENPFELVKRHQHINLIHKIIFTPAGTYLEGPEPEPANRVLRQYPKQTDHFARVMFLDEDRGPVRYDPRSDLSRIYHERFKGLLDQPTIIFGMPFSFLGFSHSSLRSQSCWFMAAMVKDGKLLFAERIIKGLGDFSSIRVPAKCAARIGQNFTDTNATVELTEDQVGELPNVERNGYDFSDGVGTISEGLLREVWRVYGTRKLLKPTVLQIRFQGAKGMVSLDPRLRGKRLMLRQNMRKYETQASWNLEICGAGFSPYPMVLNRQFIKIFEDLGIPTNVFLALQAAAMERLRLMTISSINTATLLEETEGTRTAKTPTLIRYLGQMGLDYHQDSFLYQIVEIAVVSKVREIKYRGRIPVEDGVTLYGIMDEYGVLKEGEIYVAIEKSPDGAQSVLVKNRVIVTRSPALHPGDIQLANAVDVPSDSPLKRLSNVVVFSQFGSRDLPSQLSGGDLDGDLYNIMWHDGMLPHRWYLPAEYPRIEAIKLDRDVTRKDMSDFFVTFMESDQLGMICNNHLQLADQRDNGTVDEDCITLAAMASTAVDFSKTGVPVNMKNAPRPDRCRPDFMASSPRIVVSEEGFINLEDQDYEDDEAFEGLDSEVRPYRYYRSQKTLGILYREIDEHKLLENMQKERRHHMMKGEHKSETLLVKVLQYVKHWADNYGVAYTHHRDLAGEIKTSYEETLANILYTYEPSPHSPLSETEAFAGQILGRQSGPQGKQLRDLSSTMRERFEVIVDHAIMRITKGDEAMEEARKDADLDALYDDTKYSDREFEGFPRAVACLEVAMSSLGYQDRALGELKSFKYIAAVVCLKELERYRVTTFGSYSGLPTYDL